MTHINAISNGFGAPSMYLMVLAGQKKIPATVSISADTGWENDCLLNTGERVTARQYYNDVVEPLGVEFGIETFFVRSLDKNGNELPPLSQSLPNSIQDGYGKIFIPLFGSEGGRLKQNCTGKYKVRAIRQQLRRMGATTARCALGLTMDEVHRIKPSDVKWQDIWWPLITQEKLYRSEIQTELERLNIPYLLSTECDGCPHKDYTRWKRTDPAVIEEVALIESRLDGLYFTDQRIPLKEAIENMKNKRPKNGLWDVCESGYCFT